MTAVAERITVAGVYDVPADVYHADPVEGGSLSASGARLLLPPNCPAIYRYQRDHTRPPRATFDFGHAGHKLALGVGPELVVVDADDWRTKAAKEQRKEAYEAGHVPLLRDDYEQVRQMAQALTEHPIAGKLFRPGAGKAEQTLVWRDGPTQVWRRSMLDWLPEPGRGRYIIPDYKTTRSAAPEHLMRAMVDYGYHIQGAWQTAGVRALDIDDEPAFVLVAQEKTPPYLVSVVQPSPTAMRLGELLARQALGIFAECMAADHWPAYVEGVEMLPLPAWVENQYGSEIR